MSLVASYMPRDVYVAENEAGCKIGISGQVEQRCYQLSRETGLETRIVRVFPDVAKAEYVEIAAHWTLAPHHLIGEWFKVSADAAISAVEGAQKRVAGGYAPMSVFVKNAISHRINLFAGLSFLERVALIERIREVSGGTYIAI